MYSYININELVIETKTYLKLQKYVSIIISMNMTYWAVAGSVSAYHMKPKGFCKVKYSSFSMPYYRRIAEKRLKHKCTSSYIPINWFIDYKSGFSLYRGNIHL